MGQVATVHVLMAEDPDFNFQKVAQDLQKVIPQGVKMVRYDIKPLAFGLKMLEVTCIMQDTEGIMERLEEAYRGIDGITNVEAKEVGLI